MWASARAIAMALAAAGEFLSAMARADDAVCRDALLPTFGAKLDEVLRRDLAMALAGGFAWGCARTLELEADDVQMLGRGLVGRDIRLKVGGQPVVHVAIMLDQRRVVRFGVARQGERWYVIPAGPPQGRRPWGQHLYDVPADLQAAAMTVMPAPWGAGPPRSVATHPAGSHEGARRLDA